MYRSSFIYSDGLYYVYYGARNDYSNMGTGLLVGKDIFDLKGIDIDYINEGEHAAEQLAQIAMDLKKVYWYLE